MYTEMDVFIIVVFTVLATSIITMVILSCMTANDLDEKQTEAYWKGFADGRKVGGK